MIKGLAFVGAKYSGKEKIITAGTIAIAAAAGKEIKPPAIGNKVRYIAGEEHTVRGIAHILSAATVE